MPNTPWGYGPKTFTVPAGSDQVVELRCPSRGTLDSLLLIQEGGMGSGTFALYDSAEAAAAAAGSITGDLSIAAGRHASRSLELHYSNRDGTPTNNVRKLWLGINAGMSGDFDFSLSMTIMTD